MANSGPSLSPLDAVEETKPTESAQQEEVKEEESKADQENAWTLRNYSPLPLPPSPYPLSFLPTPVSISPLPAHICEPVRPSPIPTDSLFLSVWQTFKEKKKSRKNPSQTVWLKHFFVSWCCYGEFFGNDDPIILGKFLHCIRVLWSGACVCLSAHRERTLSLLSLLQVCVCAMLPSSEESKLIERVKSNEEKKKIPFLPFSMWWNERKKKKKKRPNPTTNEK